MKKLSRFQRIIKWIIYFIVLEACVDRIQFTVPPAQFLTIIEGVISDIPGTYTVRVSKSLSLDSNSFYRNPVSNATIKLYDDEGNYENFTETAAGEYITGGVIQGKVGHAYHIAVQTSDGKAFVSDPEVINPVGAIDQIKFEYEARTVQTLQGEVSADVFNIFIDAHNGEGENYVRWRYTGSYKINTNPEFNVIYGEGVPYLKPFPCSGYIVVPLAKLLQVGPCLCCTCWISQFESIPQVSDEQLVSNHQFRNVKVGEVPINSATFSDKFMVSVEQMSLSKTSFGFFKMVRDQKTGGTNLFQPSFGQIQGNIRALNAVDAVAGLFWATSINRKIIFIEKSEIPYLLPPSGIVAEICTSFPNSTTVKPQFWQ